MFDVYRLRVLRDYNDKKAMGGLSLNLSHSTPAKLKAECLIVFDKRYLNKDEKILQSFFGGYDKDSCRLAIKKIEPDKFRPLQKCINGGTSKPDQKNIELLAWLIDYEHRPYKFDLTSSSLGVSGEEIQIIETDNAIEERTGRDKIDITQPEVLSASDEEEVEKGTMAAQTLPDDTGSLNERAANYGTGRRLKKAEKTLITICVLAIIGIGSYLILHHNSSEQANTSKRAGINIVTNGQEKCMYWTGDHFQQVACNIRINDTLVIAMDSSRLVHLKKITDPDTITTKALGRVWYIKINGRIEYYTFGGMHPVYTDLRLKPITKYIINKYFPHNKMSIEKHTIN